MEKFIKFLKWIMEITKEPIKSIIYNEAFIVLVIKFPIIPKWCTKAVLKWTLNKTINPAIDEIYADIGYKVEVKNGEILFKKIQNSTSVNEWNDLSNSV